LPDVPGVILPRRPRFAFAAAAALAANYKIEEQIKFLCYYYSWMQSHGT
jgi:hypothetical protein